MTAHVYVTRAWSCTVRLAVTEPRAMPEAAADLDALLDRVDRLASRFRADSSLSIANARAGRPAAIPRLLADLVQAALDAAAYTGGAVDPTVGRAMRRIGYDRDIAAIRVNGPAIAPSMGGARWTDVRLHRDSGLLTVPAGTELDLGATAKAYTVVLTHGGLTTSTMTVRRWRRGGRIAHHIVDPRTGRLVDGPWRTASVYAQSALAANTASTAALVRGESAVSWLADHRLAARLVGVDGVVETTPGWPVVAEPAVA